MKRRLSFLIALVLLFTALTGCAGGSNTSAGPSLWFVRSDGAGNTALEREHYTGPTEVGALTEALLAGPASDGLSSPIPKGTVLNAWKLTGSILQLDLSREYAALTGMELTLANYCIALTLTGLDNVDGVRITVNGVTRTGILRREDVLFSGAEEDPVELSAALCFHQTGGNELGVELRVFRLTENESAAMAVVNALIAGPRESGLERLLPADLEIYSARVEAGICYADFSKALLDSVPESEERQKLAVRSIVESLCSLGHIQAVQILVNGESPEYYGLVDISQPLYGSAS